MKLYIMRHGRSPSAHSAGVKSDAERPLAPEGLADVRRTLRHLKKNSGHPSLILHSPLRRAMETAEEARTLLEPKDGTAPYEPLSNEIAAAELFEKLKEKAPGIEELMVVGHQPQLGELSAVLLGQAQPLMPGGIIAVEAQTPGKCRLIWACNPEDLSD